MTTTTRKAKARTSTGQFAPGNAGGPGRPKRATEIDYLAALSDACPPDVWTRIVRRAVADAEEGDARARDWLAGYLIDRPEQRWVPPSSAPVMQREHGSPLDALATGGLTKLLGELSDDWR